MSIEKRQKQIRDEKQQREMVIITLAIATMLLETTKEARTKGWDAEQLCKHLEEQATILNDGLAGIVPELPERIGTK